MPRKKAFVPTSFCRRATLMFSDVEDSALHFCSICHMICGIAGVTGSHFPKLLDSFSEAVGFLGYCSAAMNHDLDFKLLTLNWHPITSVTDIITQGRTNPAFSKPCLFLSDTRHFRHFRRFRGSEERRPCFRG